MEFKLKTSIVALEPHLNSPGMLKVTRGCYFLEEGTVMSLESILEHLRPVGCDSLNLVDPDRDKRLCPPIINSSKPFIQKEGGNK